jgi:quinol monooxygenase YgiN
VHFIVVFEVLPAKVDDFRRALHRVQQGSRLEPGCAGFEVFESLRPPAVFAIHSRWVDEAAFDTHAALPHTVEFLSAVQPWLVHPQKGRRLRPFA